MILDGQLHLSVGYCDTNATRILLAATSLSAQFKRNAVLILACQYKTDSIHGWYRCTDLLLCLESICKATDNIQDGISVLLTWFRAKRVWFEKWIEYRELIKVFLCEFISCSAKWIRGDYSMWIQRRQLYQGMKLNQASVGSKSW